MTQQPDPSGVLASTQEVGRAPGMVKETVALSVPLRPPLCFRWSRKIKIKLHICWSAVMGPCRGDRLGEGTISVEEARVRRPPWAPCHRGVRGSVGVRSLGLRPACGEQPPTPKSQDDCTVRAWQDRQPNPPPLCLPLWEAKAHGEVWLRALGHQNHLGFE